MSLFVLVAVVPAAPVAVVACAVLDPGSWWIPAAGAIVAPVVLGYALGPTAWPRDEDRWAGAVRLAVAATALWVFGVPTALAFYLPLLCAAAWSGPAFAAGLAVYASVSLWLVRDPDPAFLTWPAAVLAGLVVLALVAGIGPHGYCET